MLIYLILAFTFGFSLLTSEIAIGRKTKQSALTAYKALNKRWGWPGVLSCVVPFLIMPYYCVIGGWVLKYGVVFLTGQGAEAAKDGYFSNYTAGTWEPLIYLVIFLVACAVVNFIGVSSGIEKMSKILMPVLFVFILGIAVYSLFLKNVAADGTVVTGMDGLKVYLIPNLNNLTFSDFLRNRLR